MADPTYRQFLLDPDQASRRAELTTFFGPHADKFLKLYDAQVQSAMGVKTGFSMLFGRAFIWPAFFLGPVWFFYRKLWAWAVGLTVLVFGLSFVPVGHLGVPIGLGMAGGAGLLYVSTAVTKIEALRRRSPGQPLNPAELAALGGVSKTAGWVAGVIYLLLPVLGLVYLIHTDRAMQSLPR